MTAPRSERVAVNPPMVRAYLQRAVVALRAGDLRAGLQCVETVLSGLDCQHALQNSVLDAWVRAQEPRAARETPPLYPGEQR